jgi:hypothetical protein
MNATTQNRLKTFRENTYDEEQAQSFKNSHINKILRQRTTHTLWNIAYSVRKRAIFIDKVNMPINSVSQLCYDHSR